MTQRAPNASSSLFLTWGAIALVALATAVFNFRPEEDRAPAGVTDLGKVLEKFRWMPPGDQYSFLRELAKTREFAEVKNFVQEAYPDEPYEKHDLGHVLGEIAIEKYGLGGFALCDEFLNFGCFHGAALAAVNAYGKVPDLAEKLWNGCKNANQDTGSCLHGLGHAILILENYNLLAAYETCERVVDNQDEFWCLDGVSMENITRSMAPPTLGAYEDDTMFSCYTLPVRYQPVCARNRLGWLEDNKGINEKEAVSFCLSFAEAEAQSECLNTYESRKKEP